jgi:hypothetical protein
MGETRFVHGRTRWGEGSALTDKPQFVKEILVLPVRIELTTSPLPMRCSAGCGIRIRTSRETGRPRTLSGPSASLTQLSSQILDNGIDGQIDPALEIHGVHASGNRLGTFLATVHADDAVEVGPSWLWHQVHQPQEAPGEIAFSRLRFLRGAHVDLLAALQRLPRAVAARPPAGCALRVCRPTAKLPSRCAPIFQA